MQESGRRGQRPCIRCITSKMNHENTRKRNKIEKVLQFLFALMFSLFNLVHRYKNICITRNVSGIVWWNLIFSKQPLGPLGLWTGTVSPPSHSLSAKEQIGTKRLFQQLIFRKSNQLVCTLIIQLDKLYLCFNLVKHGMYVYDVLPCQGSRQVSHVNILILADWRKIIQKLFQQNPSVVPNEIKCALWITISLDKYISTLGTDINKIIAFHQFLFFYFFYF